MIVTFNEEKADAIIYRVDINDGYVELHLRNDKDKIEIELTRDDALWLFRMISSYHTCQKRQNEKPE